MVNTAINCGIALLVCGQVERLTNLSFLEERAVTRCRHLGYLIFHWIYRELILARLLVRADCNAAAIAADARCVGTSVHYHIRTLLLGGV